MHEVVEISETLVPWLERPFQQIVERAENNLLPHAMLLGGEKHQGKTSLAQTIARYLLCKNAVHGHICGKCKPCHLTRAGTHPDLKRVEPIESRFIVVDTIRELVGWANQTAQQGGNKIVIIKPAEAMNIAASNALLKCLEEPVPNTVLILVSNRPGSLPATIRSRCQRIMIPGPNREQALSYLAARLSEDEDIQLLLDNFRGQPLKALEMYKLGLLDQRKVLHHVLQQLWSGDLLAHEGAQQLLKFDPEQILEMFYYWLTEMLKLVQSNKIKSNKNNFLSSKFNQICEVKGITIIYRILDHVFEQRAALLSTSNPNKQLLIEKVLVEFADLARD